MKIAWLLAAPVALSLYWHRPAAPTPVWRSAAPMPTVSHMAARVRT